MAGISWRIYQDPNDNWTAALHGCLAFESFRSAEPGSPIYENGLAQWTIDDLPADVENGTLPQVVWVLPFRLQSEHPGGPSSPQRGGDFTAQGLDALTSNDGLFDHIPPPAPPSFNIDGSRAGASTMNLAGLYLNNDKPEGAYDVTLTAGDWSRRLAGRMETGEHGVTDPAQSPAWSQLPRSSERPQM